MNTSQMALATGPMPAFASVVREQREAASVPVRTSKTKQPIARSTTTRDGLLDDVQSFNALVREHQDLAYSVAYRITGSREAAEDATQEAFLRAYERRAQFHGGNVRAWLLRIVSNTAIDELRRRKRRPQRAFTALRREDEDAAPLAYDPPDAGPGPEAAVLQNDLRRTIEAALGRLSDDFRTVVVLHDVHGLTYEQIAETAGVPIGTVRSRLSRARGQLRDLLGESGIGGTGQALSHN